MLNSLHLLVLKHLVVHFESIEKKEEEKEAILKLKLKLHHSDDCRSESNTQIIGKSVNRPGVGV